MIRVLIAEDHNLVRQGIRALLEKAEDIEVVGEAQDGHEAVRLAERLVPDVVLMDIGMPRLNGVLATEKVCALGLGTQVVILSVHNDETLVRQAFRKGARGYLLKSSIAEELLLAVRAASLDRTYLSPAIAELALEGLLASESAARKTTPLDRLTPREREVLQLVAEGHTNAQIADILEISVKTVEKHRANMMAKLNVHDVAGLTRIAIKHDLVFLDR